MNRPTAGDALITLSVFASAFSCAGWLYCGAPSHMNAVLCMVGCVMFSAACLAIGMNSRARSEEEAQERLGRVFETHQERIEK